MRQLAREIIAAAVLVAVPILACSSSQSSPTGGTGGSGNNNGNGSGGQPSSTGGGRSSASGGAGLGGDLGTAGGPGSGGTGANRGTGGGSGGAGMGGTGATGDTTGTGLGGAGGVTGSGGRVLGSGGSGGTAGLSGVVGNCPWRNTAPVTIATPFAAPDNSLTFTPPTIPCVMFPITSYGGKGDGTTVNTTAFASAVAAAKAAGGGVVDVPSGTWATGPIHLDSNIELHLESGATIQFSANAMDYLPAVLTRWEGLDVMNYSPFVYALHATNVAITGTGTLQGPGDTWGGGVANWKSGSSSEDQRVYNAVAVDALGDLRDRRRRRRCRRRRR